MFSPAISRWVSVWAVFAILASAVGCAPDSQRVIRRDAFDALPAWTPDEPTVLSVYDAACQSGRDRVELSHVRVPRWLGPSVVMDTVDFDGVRSDPWLRGDGIAGVTWGALYERRCVPGDSGCADGGFALTDGTERSLRVCRDNFEFPRESIESVALATAHFARQARHAAVIAIPGALIPDIRVMAQPRFVNVRLGVDGPNGTPVNQRGYIADNLAYMADDGEESASIAVFPESKGWPSLAAGHLWESFFVVAHEYGHHVQSAIAPRWARASGDRVVAAVGEAFADLSAYYAEGGSAVSLVGIPCLGILRDPRAASFAGGRRKVLDEDALRDFEAPNPSGTSSCESPDLHEIHAFGALLAHQVDSHLAAVVSARMGAESPTATTIRPRYALLAAWARALENRGRPARGDGVALAVRALGEVTGSYLREGGVSEAARETVCRSFVEGFPAVGAPGWCGAGF